MKLSAILTSNDRKKFNAMVSRLKALAADLAAMAQAESLARNQAAATTLNQRVSVLLDMAEFLEREATPETVGEGGYVVTGIRMVCDTGRN